MKKGKQVYIQHNFYLWLAAAAVIHAVVLFAAAYFQIWNAGNHVTPKIVTVTLVSLPGSTGGAQEFSGRNDGTEATPVQPSAKEVSFPEVKQAIKLPAAKELPLPPKAIAEKSPQSKPADRQLHINKALDSIKQLVDKKTTLLSQSSSASTLQSALAKLKQKVKLAGEPAGEGNGSVAGSRGGRSSAGKVSGRGGTSEGYKAEVASIIQKNWVFSKALLKKSEGMVVYVRINIFPDGTINQIIFDRRAVSEYLNNSVTKAIERSSPLPVLPKEDAFRDVWIGFVFSPEGIEQ